MFFVHKFAAHKLNFLSSRFDTISFTISPGKHLLTVTRKLSLLYIPGTIIIITGILTKVLLSSAHMLYSRKFLRGRNIIRSTLCSQLLTQLKLQYTHKHISCTYALIFPLNTVYIWSCHYAFFNCSTIFDASSYCSWKQSALLITIMWQQPIAQTALWSSLPPPELLCAEYCLIP